MFYNYSKNELHRVNRGRADLNTVAVKDSNGRIGRSQQAVQLQGGLTLCLAFLLLISSFSSFAAPAAKTIKFWDDSEPTSEMKVNHSVWQSILTKYLDDQHLSGINRFDYKAVTGVDLTRLNDYIEYLQLLEPRQLNRSEQVAFWLNFYNAKVVQLVAKRMRSDSISSIRQVRAGVFTPGPWTLKNISLVQQKLSLDDIEHGVLRPNFKDKRILFALSRASLGGGNLLKSVYTSANLEAQLLLAEKSFLNHARAMRMDGGVLVLNEMFQFYDTDFAVSEPGLYEYLKPFMNEELAAEFESRSETRYEYDWNLNMPDKS